MWSVHSEHLKNPSWLAHAQHVTHACDSYPLIDWVHVHVECCMSELMNLLSSFWMFLITKYAVQQKKLPNMNYMMHYFCRCFDSHLVMLCVLLLQYEEYILLGLLIWCCCNCTEGNFSLWDWGKSEILPEKNIVGWNWKARVMHVHACSITSFLNSINLAILLTFTEY